MVSKDDFLFNVENEYNGVSVQAAFADQQFFFGKGAGGHPTGAAVFSDISALRYDYKYEYKKAKQNLGLSLDNNVGIEVYFRFNSAELLKEINFNDVSESYNSKNYNYVVGTLTIAELIAKKEIILNDGAFVAETGKREVNH